MNFYSTFLGIKGLLNLGAGVAAAVTGRTDIGRVLGAHRARRFVDGGFCMEVTLMGDILVVLGTVIVTVLLMMGFLSLLNHFWRDLR